MIVIYTDGACAYNPGPGGWGYVILNESGGIYKAVNGAQQNTTNNRMEIQAVLEALKCIQEPSDILIMSDSQYVVKSINEWLDNWIEEDRYDEERSNKDLWDEFLLLRKKHTSVKAQHVRGHSGEYYNELANQLATDAVKGRIK